MAATQRNKRHNTRAVEQIDIPHATVMPPEIGSPVASAGLLLGLAEVTTAAAAHATTIPMQTNNAPINDIHAAPHELIHSSHTHSLAHPPPPPAHPSSLQYSRGYLPVGVGVGPLYAHPAGGLLPPRTAMTSSAKLFAQPPTQIITQQQQATTYNPHAIVGGHGALPVEYAVGGGVYPSSLVGVSGVVDDLARPPVVGVVHPPSVKTPPSKHTSPVHSSVSMLASASTAAGVTSLAPAAIATPAFTPAINAAATTAPPPTVATAASTKPRRTKAAPAPVTPDPPAPTRESRRNERATAAGGEDAAGGGGSRRERATSDRHSDRANGGGGGDHPVDKQKKRLMRKAELARASRRRKKAYVGDLEDKLSQLVAQNTFLLTLLNKLPSLGGLLDSAGKLPAGLVADKITSGGVQLRCLVELRKDTEPSDAEEDRSEAESDEEERQPTQTAGGAYGRGSRSAVKVDQHQPSIAAATHVPPPATMPRQISHTDLAVLAQAMEVQPPTMVQPVYVNTAAAIPSAVTVAAASASVAASQPALVPFQSMPSVSHDPLRSPVTPDLSTLGMSPSAAANSPAAAAHPPATENDLPIKANFRNEWRRFLLPRGSVTFAVLLDTLGHLFSLSPSDAGQYLRVRYQDSDGDDVAIQSTAELVEAARGNQAKNAQAYLPNGAMRVLPDGSTMLPTVLRLFVTHTQDASATIPTPPSVQMVSPAQLPHKRKGTDSPSSSIGDDEEHKAAFGNSPHTTVKIETSAAKRTKIEQNGHATHATEQQHAMAI